MAKQIINVGTAPNDGTGDTLKTSFTKCNGNFTELYNAIAAGSSLTISDTPPSSPNNGALWWESDTGTLFVSYNDGTSTQWIAVGGGTSIVTSSATSPPQGRLTLQAATPVMTTTQSAKILIYYTPYVGNLVPIFDGTNFVMTACPEISGATTDSTFQPAIIGASKVNDWFVWNNAGNMRLVHGPDWTNDTTRSAGTALTMVNGIWLNNAAITNGPAAQRGTYVGTTRSNASSQLDWLLGGQAAGGSPIFFGVWNAYNRVNVYGESGDTTASWTISSGIRMMDGSANLRASAVFGLAEDPAIATVIGSCNEAAGASFTAVLNSTTAVPASGLRGLTYGNGNAHNASSSVTGNAVLGFNYWQAMEWATGAGSSAPLSVGMFGLAFQARM